MSNPGSTTTRGKRTKTKKPWHKGTHQVRARKVVDRANADPTARCWRCGRTLAEHPRHKTGKPARWTAGHVVDGQVNGVLRAEASTCNFTEGARLGNARAKANRRPTLVNTNISRTWQ